MDKALSFFRVFDLALFLPGLVLYALLRSYPGLRAFDPLAGIGEMSAAAGGLATIAVVAYRLGLTVHALQRLLLQRARWTPRTLQAETLGLLPPGRGARALARFFVGVTRGMAVVHRGSGDLDAVREIARVALAILEPPIAAGSQPHRALTGARRRRLVNPPPSAQGVVQSECREAWSSLRSFRSRCSTPASMVTASLTAGRKRTTHRRSRAVDQG